MYRICAAEGLLCSSPFPLLLFSPYLVHKRGTFSFNAVVTAPVVFLVFGGVNVAGAPLNAMVADVAKSEGKLIKIFGYNQSTTQIVQFLEHTLSAASMPRSFWTPFWLGLSSLILVIPATILIPDTPLRSMPNNVAADANSSMNLLQGPR